MKKQISKTNKVHRIFVTIYLVSALLTVIPCETISKECRLGYKALCSFTPYSTLILVSLLIFHVILAMNKARKSQGGK